MASDRPLALTMGEPAGIGPELALLAWKSAATPPFVYVGDPDQLADLSERLGLAVPLRLLAPDGEDNPASTHSCFSEALPVVPLALPTRPEPGRIEAGNADAVVASIRTAAALARAGQVAAMVTNPIQKETLYDAGFSFGGHTEFLGHLAGVDGVDSVDSVDGVDNVDGVDGADHRPVMMLVSTKLDGPPLRVVPVTVHLALTDAIQALTVTRIVSQGRAVDRALRRDFALDSPRLAMAALNPHAGEQGAMGREERTIIGPAAERLRAEGIDITRPLPADTLFHQEARQGFDAVICMHHDQALIPLKTLDFFHGVNVTLNLPFIRTSPDHGTALDLAGSGRAHPGSLAAAMSLAAALARQRARASRSDAVHE